MDTAIVKLDAAQAALAECKTVMEAKQIADVAEAARVYLERTNASAETVNRATEIRLLAERQMGEFLKGMPKNPGVLKIGSAVPEGNHGEPTLAEIGITKKQSHIGQKLAEIGISEDDGARGVGKSGVPPVNPTRAIEPNAIYSVAEAARLTTLSAFTMRRYLRLGVIRGKGRPWRIRGAELLKLA